MHSRADPAAHGRGGRSSRCRGARRRSCHRDLGNALGVRALLGTAPDVGPNLEGNRGSTILLMFVFYPLSRDTGVRNSKI